MLSSSRIKSPRFRLSGTLRSWNEWTFEPVEKDPADVISRGAEKETDEIRNYFKFWIHEL